MLVSIQFKCKLIHIWSFQFIVRICYNDLIVQINRSHVIVRIGRNNYVYKWIPSQWRRCWANRHIFLVVALVFFVFPLKAANYNLPHLLPWFFVLPNLYVFFYTICGMLSCMFFSNHIRTCIMDSYVGATFTNSYHLCLVTIYELVYISTKYYDFVWLPHTNSYISAFRLYKFNPMNLYIIWLCKFIGKLIQIWSFHFIVRICYNNLFVQINRLHVIVRIGRNNYVYKWIPS